jgi:hypothetical protein
MFQFSFLAILLFFAQHFWKNNKHSVADAKVRKMCAIFESSEKKNKARKYMAYLCLTVGVCC